MVSKMARKVKDVFWRTENTNLRALSSLSENSFYINIVSKGAEATPGEKGVSPDQFESVGLESDEKNIAPEDTFTDARLEVHENHHFLQ